MTTQAELSFTLSRETSTGQVFTDCVRITVPVPISAKAHLAAAAEAEAEMDRRVAAFEEIVATPAPAPDPVVELERVAEQVAALEDQRAALVDTITADPELSARADENPVVAAVIDQVQAQADTPV